VKFTVLSLFPEILEGYFNASIMAKAVEKGLITYELINIRDFADDKHKTCDDAPYGGGAGMVLKAGPIAKAFDSLPNRNARNIYLSASGKKFDIRLAAELAEEKEIVFLCGRYEGIDQRAVDLYVNDEICIGDYVLSSGEVAALVCIDVIYRLREGIINRRSLEEESFEKGLLEYPHYTRPEVFNGIKVPEVLLSGHHAHIKKWRIGKQLQKTLQNRPELLRGALKDTEVYELYKKMRQEELNDGSFKNDRGRTEKRKC
jgi:tRNA (guanine37-N1)-methyltransferase